MSRAFRAVEQDGSYSFRCATFWTLSNVKEFLGANPELKGQQKEETLWESMIGMAADLENASEATGNIAMEEKKSIYLLLMSAYDKAAAALREAANLQKQLEPEGEWKDI